MPNPTGYYRPRTIDEAVQLLSQPYIKTALLSGGALRLATDDLPYEALIDVQAIEGLSSIVSMPDGVLAVGAATSLEAVVRWPEVPALLRDTLRRCLTWNRRNAISIAELVEYPEALPEAIAALLALDVTLVFAMPEERRIRLQDLQQSVSQPRLPEKGLIVRFEFAATNPWQTWGQAHVARTPADTAIVSAAAVLIVDNSGTVAQARIALSGVWDVPARLAEGASVALTGRLLDAAAIARAIAALNDEIAPVADYRGSVAYRRAMAGVVTRRALEACQARLAG
ncbi:MAG: hypothetical protein HPY64_17095 [Anaerolineae bacterium]|nr:hypothetical protein [Anaerolineae bacterium]